MGISGKFLASAAAPTPSEVAVNNNNSYKLLGHAGIINIDFVDSRREQRLVTGLPGDSSAHRRPLPHSYVVNSFRRCTYVSRKLFSDCSVTNKPRSHARQTVKPLNPFAITTRCPAMRIIRPYRIRDIFFPPFLGSKLPKRKRERSN